MLVWAKLKSVSAQGLSEGCGSKRYDTYNYIDTTNIFSNSSNSRSFFIKFEKLNCNSECAVYLIQCQTCRIQYVGSTSTKFGLRFNTYKRSHSKHLNVVSFHSHFCQHSHQGMKDWKIILIRHILWGHLEERNLFGNTSLI